MNVTSPIRPLYQAETYRSLLFLLAESRSPPSCWVS